MRTEIKQSWLFLAFFCYLTFIYSQNNTNYFDIVNDKQFEFNTEFKKENSSERTLALDKSYKKFARWQWFWQNRIDKSGSFESYHKEYFAANNISKLRESAILNTTEKANWKIVGPERYPDGTNPKGIKGIGRIDAIVRNPKNKNHVIIGARAGGIWETYTINDSIPYWKCLTNNLPIATVNDLKIIDNTLFAATSNKTTLLAQGNKRYGLGVIKKNLTDTIWQLPNQPFESKNIAISKKNKNILYSAGEKYIYKSINSGDTWKKLNDPIPNITNSKLFLTNIEINPNDDDIIIITGKLYVYDLTDNKKTDILIFKSENGGKTWQNLTTDLESFINKEFETSHSKDEPISLTKGLKNQISTFIYKEQLFLCIQQRHHKNYVYFVNLDDSWNSFKLFNSISKQNTYHFKTDNVDAKFQVINDNEILIGNRKLRLINNKNHTIKSLDNNYKYLHQDIRAINYDASINRLLIGTDGGINMNIETSKNNNLTTFRNISGNLNLFLAFNMSYINKNGMRTIRIGNQDTGYYKSDNSGENWTNWTRFGPFGEGMIYTDPYDTNIVYRINAGGHGGNLQKSIDSGNKFTNTKVKTGNYNFAPLEIDKNNTNNLIFDNYKRYDQYTLSLSNNQMKTSIDISNGMNQLDKGMNLALAISKKNPSVFYVARKSFQLEKHGVNNAIYKSENFDFNNPENITYTNITENLNKTDPTITQNAFVSDIELNDNNENEVWVSFGNLENQKKIYYSENGGLDWKNISSNLPNVPVNVLKFDTKNNTLYAGNDYGVYIYNNTSKQWNRYGKGLPISIVTAIEIDSEEKELIAATHGRSVWTSLIKKNENTVISSNTIWSSNQTINGDLIIKENTSLTLKNINLEANNIIIEKNAFLNSINSSITSNNKNSYGNHLNTNLILNSYANFSATNTRIENYTIDINNYSIITFSGEENIILKNSRVKVYENASYHHHKKTKLTLEDKDASIIFFKNVKLGEKPNFTKIYKIKFKGNGSVKMY